MRGRILERRAWPLLLLSVLLMSALVSSPVVASSYAHAQSGSPQVKVNTAAESQSLSLQGAGRDANPATAVLGENQAAPGVSPPNELAVQAEPPIDLGSAGSSTTLSPFISDTSPQVIYANAPSSAISSSPERKLFYSSGYWFAFWQESNSPFAFVYSSSPDEVTWSAPTAVVTGASNQCECASVWVSGGTVYYAQTTGTNDFYYDSGTIAGGVITWSAATTVPTVYNTQDTSGYQSSISVITDTLGDPWVAVYTENGVAGVGPQYAEVYEYTGGTWAAANSPIASPNAGPEFLGASVQIVPLPKPSPGVPGAAVLYSFVDCTGCFTGVSLQYTTGISGGVLTWSPVIRAGADYAEFSATAVGNTIYIAGSLGSGGVDFSYYTTGQPAASSPVSIASGNAWTRFGSSGGTDVSISQGTSGSDTLVIFYENFISDNVDYSVGSIGTGGAVTWGAAQGIYSTPPPASTVFGVSSVDTATAGDEFGVVFPEYPGGIIQLYFASITVSFSSTVPVSITLNPSSGTSPSLSATNYFSVTYTSGGSPETADQVGGTLNLDADPSTNVTISAMSSGSGSTQQWCLYLCSTDTFSSGASGASATLVYYQQYLEQASYSTSGGAPPSNWCPHSPCYQNFDYSSAGLPLSVQLMLTPTSEFIDVGSTWSVVDPAFGSTASEGWFAIPSTSSITTGPATASAGTISGTVSAIGSVALVYYHEYSLQASYSTSDGTTISATITLDGTQSGAPAGITLFTVALPSWLDAGSSWTVTPSTVTISSTSQYVLASDGSGSVSAPTPAIDPVYKHQSPSPPPPQQFPVLFEEAGLAANNQGEVAPWSVTLNGQTQSSSDPTITFSEPKLDTPYLYSIPCVEELCPTVARGQVTVNGGITLVNVQFIGPWSSYLHDSQQTAQSPYVAAQAATLEWTFLAGDPSNASPPPHVCPIPPPPPNYETCYGTSAVSSPAIGPDGTIYFGDFGATGATDGTTNLYAGNLFALNPDGSLKWVFDTQGNIAGATPAVGPDGTIYIGTSEVLFSTGAVGQNSILAINPDGTLKWQMSLPSASSGLASVDGAGQLSFEIAPGGNTIYAVAGATLYALHASNGFVDWQVTLGTPFDFGSGIYSEAILSSPVVGPSGAIYVVGSVPGPNCVPVELASCTQDYSLFSISPGGAINWQVALNDPAYQSGPAVDSNGIIYTACGAASICAYNPGSSLKWMVALPTTSCDAAEQAFAAATTPCTYQVLPTTTLVIGPGGTLLVPTEQLATASGENARGPTTDVYYGPYLFYALNSADGSIKWSVDTYDPILNSPAIGADGTIYMECAGLGPSGDVCAYSSAGTELWDYDTQYALGSLGPTDVQGSYGINSSPAIGADGTIYVGDVYGHLWAIGPGPTGTLLKMSKLVFELHSPINILVTLPDGQQAGFDAAGTLVNTAGATVIPPDPAMGQLETVSFADPTAGQYELQIFGTGAGPFTVTAQSFGTDGSVLGSTSYTGTATNGSEQTSYLGLVGGGQMSMLLNLGLSNSLLTLGCAPVSMRAGATTTCTATLLDASGSITGENIKFSETMNSEGVDFPSPSSCTIISGDSCSVVVTSTGTGTATIQASYAGDASNAATSAESSLAITSAQSSTGVSCAPLPVAVGSASTCTATVTGASPTGALTWTTSGVGGFGAASTCKLSAGTCSVAYTPASSGTPVTISALYIGDSDNNGSSGAFSLVVTKASTTTSVSCQPASAPVDSPFACTAVVGGLSPGGTVSFASTSSTGTFSPSNGECALSVGRCSVTYMDSAGGTPTITATYGGDSDNAGSPGTFSPSITGLSTTSSTTRSSSSSSSSSSSTITSSSSSTSVSTQPSSTTSTTSSTPAVTVSSSRSSSTSTGTVSTTTATTTATILCCSSLYLFAGVAAVIIVAAIGIAVWRRQVARDYGRPTTVTV